MQEIKAMPLQFSPMKFEEEKNSNCFGGHNATVLHFVF
jgi:hypothetical protein